MSCYNRYRRKKKHGKKRKGKKYTASYKRKQRRPVPKGGSKRCNCHHLLWQKRHWRSRYAKELREFWYCKVDIPAETIHRYIHCAMEGIPVPSEITCKRALRELHSLDKRGALNPNDDPIKRLQLLICLLDGSLKRTDVALREELAIFVEWNNANSEQPDNPA